MVNRGAGGNAADREKNAARDLNPSAAAVETLAALGCDARHKSRGEAIIIRIMHAGRPGSVLADFFEGGVVNDAAQRTCPLTDSRIPASSAGGRFGDGKNHRTFLTWFCDGSHDRGTSFLGIARVLNCKDTIAPGQIARSGCRRGS